MDRYVAAYIRVHVHVDGAQRVWCKNDQLEVHENNGVRMVVLPEECGSKLAYTFEDLKIAGARVDVPTVQSLAQLGAASRWKENIEARRKIGLPRNVYVANARSIEYAAKRGRTAPPVKYVGRVAKEITEDYDSVDEVVEALSNRNFKTKFTKGRRARQPRQGPG